MRINTKSYPAKLLLFGEYTVILGSKALAMPLPRFYGKWKVEKNRPDQDLQHFFDYLIQTSASLFDVTAMEKQLHAGLRFASNIPQGYGLGSSGALCAAVYNTFAIQKTKDLQELKHIFAQMESHFHGSSSGTDPLICYLEEAVLLADETIELIPNFRLPKSDTVQFFLLDAGVPRKTQPLVHHFLASCQQEHYQSTLERSLLPLVEEVIEAILQSKAALLLDLMHEISFFQLRFFEKMIPEYMQQFWKEGLASDWFKLKLCGAGGGGFFLGITNNMERMKKTSVFDVIPIQ